MIGLIFYAITPALMTVIKKFKEIVFYKDIFSENATKFISKWSGIKLLLIF